MGNCFGKKQSYSGYDDDEDLLDEDEEGEEGEVVVSQRYSYANHRRSRFDVRARETDDPASDADENLRRLALGMQGGESSAKRGRRQAEPTKKSKSKKKTKFDQNNNMLQDMLEGKKKGFFMRKLAKLRGKPKKKDDNKKEAPKETKKEKKERQKREKEAKEREKKAAKEREQARKKEIKMVNMKSKNKESTRQAMREMLAESSKDASGSGSGGGGSPPVQAREGELVGGGADGEIRDLRMSITRKERRESVADLMLAKQMMKYKERFKFSSGGSGLRESFNDELE